MRPSFSSNVFYASNFLFCHLVNSCSDSLNSIVPNSITPNSTAPCHPETLNTTELVKIVVDPMIGYPGPSEYNQRILTVHRPGSLAIPLLKGRKLVDVNVPPDSSIQSWVERVTFSNAPTMYLPIDARPDPATRTVFVAKTTEAVCWTNTSHTATLFAQPQVTGPWTTEITFCKTTRGFACGNDPPYPSSVSRCMARFTTPWNFIFTRQVAKSSSSTWTVTVPGPHFGNADPLLYVNDSSAGDYDWPCHDEGSCYDLCEDEARAALKTAIITWSVFGSMILLLPIAYFIRQPRHLKNLRRRSRERQSTEEDGQPYSGAPTQRTARGRGRERQGSESHAGGVDRGSTLSKGATHGSMHGRSARRGSTQGGGSYEDARSGRASRSEGVSRNASPSDDYASRRSEEERERAWIESSRQANDAV